MTLDPQAKFNIIVRLYILIIYKCMVAGLSVMFVCPTTVTASHAEYGQVREHVGLLRFHYIQSTPDIKNQEIHKDLFFITEVLYKRSVC